MLIIGFIKKFLQNYREERLHQRQMKAYQDKRCEMGEHDWGKWVEDDRNKKQPVDLFDHYQFRYCKNCGFKKTVKVPRYELRG